MEDEIENAPAHAWKTFPRAMRQVDTMLIGNINKKYHKLIRDKLDIRMTGKLEDEFDREFRKLLKNK